MSSDRVLVTGASGFVGSAVSRSLVARGHNVRALVRPTSRTAHLAEIGVELAVGDVRDPVAVRAALDGVRFLFHVAADYRLWARRPHEIDEINVIGTRVVMSEAMRAGLERVVYTSTVATLQLRDDGRPADEERQLPHAHARNGAYKSSKLIAEQLVDELVGQGLPAVIVNPSTPIGPGDARPTPTGRLILNAAAGRMPGFVDTGLNFVHVDDVAAGQLAALERGRIGERYILGGQNASLKQLLAVVAAEMGRAPPRVKIPRGAVLPFALAAEAVAAITDHEPFITRAGLRMSKSRMYFTSAKAERELGFSARPYEEAVREAIAWYRRHGYIRT
jgi:dihydroflavonol-4-reductase